MAKFLDYATGLPALWAKIKGIIPTKTSDLTNDSGFVTSAPSSLSDLDDVQILSGLSSMQLLAYSGAYNKWINTTVDYKSVVKGTVEINGSVATLSEDIGPQKITTLFNNKVVTAFDDDNNDLYYLTGYTYASYNSQSGAYRTVKAIFTAVDGNTLKTIVTPEINTAHTVTTWGNCTLSTTTLGGGATYTLSMSGNVITLTPSSGTASSITLPVYDGSVSGVLT